MWRDFPRRLCDAAGCRGLVYSRPGYGRSTPRAAEEAWDLDFMHRQAHEVLPALLTGLGVDSRGRATLAVRPQRRCLDRAAVRRPLARAHRRGRSCWRRTSWSRTSRWPASPRRARPTSTADLRDAAGALPRRPRLGVLGLERRLAAAAVQALVDRGRDRRDTMPAAGRAGPRRRVRHTRTDSRHRAARATDASTRAARLRSLAAA